MLMIAAGPIGMPLLIASKVERVTQLYFCTLDALLHRRILPLAHLPARHQCGLDLAALDDAIDE